LGQFSSGVGEEVKKAYILPSPEAWVIQLKSC
jgi:hypothetical protein